MEENLETILHAPIVAWRKWRIGIARNGQARLVSVTYQDFVWPAQSRLVALCAGMDSKCKAHEVPATDHTCGIYGVKEPDELANWGHGTCSTVTHSEILGEPAVGQVYLWGKIVRHERGYRGQYAYPKEIWIPYNDHDLRRDLHEEYRIPVHLDG